MSCPSPAANEHQPRINVSCGDNTSSNSSDYGSDFTPDEEELLNDLLSKIGADSVTATTTIASVVLSDLPLVVPDIEDYERPHNQTVSGPRTLEERNVPRRRRLQRSLSEGIQERKTIFGRTRWGAEHPNSPEGREQERRREREREAQQVAQLDPGAEESSGEAVPDIRSPLECFRRPPRKALSVTDLVSPAWCELQYWYSLTKHGRKRPTPAMEQGSVVHKTLEEQVHTTVPVEVMTREDGWALRIWNVIQGLRTLRTTGMTRELEVWGVIDGEVVTGIIDQLSYECPDPELAASAEAQYADVRTSRSLLPEYQSTITEYFLSAAGGGKRLSDFGVTGSETGEADTYAEPVTEKIYITDIKTRSPNSRSVPSVKSSGFRPTHLQLQLYYHLLSRLVTTDDTTIDAIASRFSLDAHKPFSDSFIAEVSNLNQEFFDDLVSSAESDSDYNPPSSGDNKPQASQQGEATDSLNILLQNNSLSRLWSLMKSQLRLTCIPPDQLHNSTPTTSDDPDNNPAPTLISPVLTASYISSSHSPGEPVRYLGSRSFLFDSFSLYPFLAEEMRWWRGLREARGVNVSDAWKCRICEFRDECTWRLDREKEFARSRRLKREGLIGEGEGSSLV